MKDKKTVLFPAFRKVFPEDFENWLEDMAAEGWHVDHIGQWNSLLMTFKRGEPKKYRFVYDLQALPRKDYMETYKQFGWESVGQMASVHIWRMPYSDERPDAFSNAEDIASRNRRTVQAVSVSFFIFLAWVSVMTVLLVFFPDIFTNDDRVQIFWAVMFSLVCTLLLGFVMFYIKGRAKKQINSK